MTSSALPARERGTERNVQLIRGWYGKRRPVLNKVKTCKRQAQRCTHNPSNQIADAWRPKPFQNMSGGGSPPAIAPEVKSRIMW
mmetsp:Transcript_1911/g.11773  ORF Transcript_1911/g.11773 Transcript_1911/m.11773 type:complete len:84 (-) Transcript_1911:1444-1695(-)